ncbi:hypothetical protein PVAP13_2NG249603 [Panicum virgatum]|uniref:Uncharacterized protein n=1 Tax=Panicum virgatum TaxID=38727 RepID=A0A8T0VLC3_PANVG|nr:hypothetical protein PVAP13_2NG249603 [Panicum virgatum]
MWHRPRRHIARGRLSSLCNSFILPARALLFVPAAGVTSDRCLLGAPPLHPLFRAPASSLGSARRRPHHFPEASAAPASSSALSSRPALAARASSSARASTPALAAPASSSARASRPRI